MHVQAGNVGRKLCTRMIGIIDEKPIFGVNDAEDFVYQYKNIEDS